MSIAITGIGYIGPGAASWRQALAAGLPVFTPWPDGIETPCEGARMGLAGNFPRARFLSDREAAKTDRLAALAVTAAGLALEDAGLSTPLPADTAAFFATCRGEIGSGQRYAAPLFQGRPRMLNPGLFPPMCRNLFCGQVAISFGLSGTSSMMSGGPLSGLHALARGARAIRRGRAPIALVGAAETLSKFSLDVAHALYGARTGAAPCFFADEGGLVPAEGAAMLVLEDAAAARARGGRIYAVLEDAKFTRDNSGALEADWNSIGFVSCAQTGGGTAQDIAEQQMLRALGPACPPLAAARSLTGEAESVATLAQVILAAQALADRSVPAVRHADAASGLPLCRMATAVKKSRALVHAMDAAWNTAVLTLSEAP